MTREPVASEAEPDPRTVLANRRTFLAWMRTSLGFIASGAALGLVALPMEPLPRALIAYLLIAVGATVALVGWRDWARTERALRRSEPVRAPGLLILVPLALCVVAVIMGVALATAIR